MDENAIGNWVDHLVDERLLMPEVQRRYVWKSTQVRDLFDSLYRDYPVGSILVWDRPMEDGDGRVADVGDNAGRKRTRGTMLLLDGQQRLTSLSAIMRDKELKVRGCKDSMVDILFNVNHPAKDVENDDLGDSSCDTEEDEEGEQDEDSLDLRNKTFIVALKKFQNQPNWVSLRRIFREKVGDIWRDVIKRMGISSEDPKSDEIRDRLEKIKAIEEIKLNVIKLGKEKNYQEVTDIFCRVNSAGSRLKGSDLALAQITSRWNDSLPMFEEFQKKYMQNKAPLFDMSFLIRALVVFTKGQCKFKTVSSTPVEQFKDGWKVTKEALGAAIDILREQWDIPTFSLLSAPSLVITMAYYIRARRDKTERLSDGELAALHKWLLIASVCGHYSKGSSETMMDQDLAIIRNGGSIGDLSAIFKEQGWKEAIQEGDIAGKMRGSAYFGLMYLAMRAAGAKDWHLRTKISLNTIGTALKLQYHHIIPDAQLKRAEEHYDPREINDIANFAFIGGHTNRNISDNDPKYLTGINLEDRKAQCVPLDESLYSVDRYRDFLTARRKLIVEMLNNYLAGIA